MNRRKMMGAAIVAVSMMVSSGVSVYAEDDVNATVIWRAFDDQFQSGFRIIMENEEENTSGIKLDMQDAENQVSVANNKLDMALTKGTDIVAICAPDRESTAEMAQKCDAENVPSVFFNMQPMDETMEEYDNIWYVGAEASESGAMCAQALINYWNENKEIADKNGDGKLQLCILQGELGQQDVVLRTQAYKDTLEAAGVEYEVLAEDTANWDQAQAFSGTDEECVKARKKIEDIAARHGVEPAVIVYAWIMYHPVGAIPLVGSQKLDRLDLAIKALDVKLEQSEWFELYSASGQQVIR